MSGNFDLTQWLETQTQSLNKRPSSSRMITFVSEVNLLEWSHRNSDESFTSYLKGLRL